MLINQAISASEIASPSRKLAAPSRTSSLSSSRLNLEVDSMTWESVMPWLAAKLRQYSSSSALCGSGSPPTVPEPED